MSPTRVQPFFSAHRFFGATLLMTVLLLGLAATTSAGNPPDFRLKDLDGKWFSLGDHLGNEVIYVTFWATWCVPCRREMPHLEKLAKDFGDQGFLVIGVNTDPPATKSKIKPYLKRIRISYTNILDPDNNVLDKYNPTRELPYGVLIDRTGSVVESFVGYRAGDEIRLRELVQSLLGEHPTEELAVGEAP